MKIPPRNVESLLKAPKAEAPYFLFYGPERGQIALNLQTLQKATVSADDPFSLLRWNYKEICEDPAKFHDEIIAPSFFGGKKFIQIDDVTASLPKEVETILEKLSPQAVVAFVADELPPSSSVRKFFENSQKAYAIACYKEEKEKISEIIRRKIVAEGKTIEPEALHYFAQAMDGDVLIIESEIEKLLLYTKNQPLITLALVQDSVGRSSAISLDALCNALAEKKSKSIKQALDLLLEEAVAPAQMCRMLERYFSRILSVQLQLKEGKTIEQAMASLQPPVFFKQIPAFKNHVRQWSITQLSLLLKQLIEWEKNTKSSTYPPDVVTRYSLEVKVCQ